MPTVNLFSSTTGLNTTVDEASLGFDAKTGETELAKATNVSITKKGRPELRKGFFRVALGEFHSLFCDDGPCLVVQERTNDAALMMVATDLSLSGIRSPLTKGLRMAYWQDGDTTYYSNGAENGIIVDGISKLWPNQTNHVGKPTSTVYFPAPVGTHITVAHGRMWIFAGAVLWYSEPFAYGKFDLGRCYVPFATDGRVVRGVKNGMWVSDSEATYFLEGTNPSEMVPARKAGYPLIEWSDAIQTVDAAEYGYEWTPGRSLIAGSREGLCLLGPSGEFADEGKKKLIMPPGVTKGSTLVMGDNVIHSAWC
jgi:hypothetical protein